MRFVDWRLKPGRDRETLGGRGSFASNILADGATLRISIDSTSIASIMQQIRLISYSDAIYIND